MAPAKTESILNWIAVLIFQLWRIATSAAPGKNVPVRKLSSREIRRRTKSISRRETAQSDSYLANSTTDYERYVFGRRLRAYKGPWYEIAPGRKGLKRLDHRVRAALRDLSQCDWSTYVLLPIVKQIIQLIDPSATVEWLLVHPAPRFQFVPPGERLSNPWHSVIRIWIGGQTFIIDLTGAQFGNRTAFRAVKWKEYKRKWIVRAADWAGTRYTSDTAEHQESIDELAKKGAGGYYHTVRCAFQVAYETWCGCLKGGEGWWKMLAELPEEDREARFKELLEITKQLFSSEVELRAGPP